MSIDWGKRQGNLGRHEHLAEQILDLGTGEPWEPGGPGGSSFPLTGNVSADGHKITDLANPNDDQDVATKDFVVMRVAAIRVASVWQVHGDPTGGTFLFGFSGGSNLLVTIPFDADEATIQGLFDLQAAGAVIIAGDADDFTVTLTDTTQRCGVTLDSSDLVDGPMQAVELVIGGLGIPGITEVPDLAEELNELAVAIPIKVTGTLSTAQIATLFSDPIEIVGAPGAGKIIVPIAGVFQYIAGTEPFGIDDAAIELRGGASLAMGIFGSLGMGGVTNVFSQYVPDAVLDPAAENQPLVLQASSELGYSGPITASSVYLGGVDYAEDDTFEASGNLNGGTEAEGVVDTVDGNGAILTFHLTDPGTRFSEGEMPIIIFASSGAGTGAQLFINSVDPQSDGTARVTVWYYVTDLAT